MGIGHVKALPARHKANRSLKARGNGEWIQGEESYAIAVLGMGHVGLPTALGLAELGWQVFGADEDVRKIEQLRLGRPPFYEPRLQDLLTKHIASGKFRPIEDVDSAVAAAKVVFVCVGTPQRENGAADLSQIEAVARTIARSLNGYKLVVEKSTVPASTGERLRRAIMRYAAGNGNGNGNGKNGASHNGNGFIKAQGKNGHSANGNGPAFEIASNPEFLQEGRAVDNFFNPDRIVIGVESEKAREILEGIYRPFKCPLVVTDLTTAELIKHAANAFLSTKISFINLMSDLCEAVGGDITSVARGIGLDPRIGPKFLRAGIGFGGYCFPKDLRALIYLAERNSVPSGILRAVEEVNSRRIDVFMEKLHHALWVLQGKTVAVLGLAFKPLTDDVREAPSLRIIEELLKEGAAVRLYDPVAMPNAKEVFPADPQRVQYCESAYDAARGASAALLVTEWDEFRSLDWSKVRKSMEVPVLLDGRNFLDPGEMIATGFEYFSMGRSPRRFFQVNEPEMERKLSIA